MFVRATVSQRGRRPRALQGFDRVVEVGSVTRLRLRIGPRTVQRLRRELRRGRRVAVVMRVTAVDAAGNVRRVSRRIRLVG
jgi:hypothetical protein